MELSLEDAEFAIKRWHMVTPTYQRLSAELILGKFKGLQEEAAKMLDEIDRLQPPVDSTGIIPVGEHVKALGEKDRAIGELRSQIKALEWKLAAHTLYCGKPEAK